MINEQVWRGTVALSWRNDCYGKPDRALYVGGLNIGHILHSPTNPVRTGHPWRAWLQTDEDGSPVGWYPTEQEAKDALVDAAIKALLI